MRLDHKGGGSNGNRNFMTKSQRSYSRTTVATPTGLNTPDPFVCASGANLNAASVY